MEQPEARGQRNVRKLNNDFFRALDEYTEALSLEELSQLSGVKIELLRRYLDRKVRTIRAETWDRIYPALKPYLEGPEPPQEPPPRIGSAYRRHPELVEMLSEQKVLLDEFAIFSDSKKKEIINGFSAALGDAAAPTEYSSLTALENKIMGIFLAMSKEMRDEQLAALSEKATREVRRRRENLF